MPEADVGQGFQSWWDENRDYLTDLSSYPHRLAKAGYQEGERAGAVGDDEAMATIHRAAELVRRDKLDEDKAVQAAVAQAHRECEETLRMHLEAKQRELDRAVAQARADIVAWLRAEGRFKHSPAEWNDAADRLAVEVEQW